MDQPCHRRRREAFTLTELLVVVGLLSLFVGTVAVKYKTPLQEVRLRTAVERIEGLDRRLRLVARDSGEPVELRIVLGRGAFSSSGGRGTDSFAESYVLPSGLHLECVHVDGRRINNDEALIRFTSAGATATYAVVLNLANDEQRCLLVLGQTGQTVFFEDETSMKPFLSLE